MALVKFRLHRRYKNGDYKIRLSYLCEGGTYVATTHERVKADNWDHKKQRVKISAKNAGAVNHELDEQEKRLYAIVREIRGKGQRVTPGAIRAKLRGYVADFWDFCKSFVLDPPQGIGKNTLITYVTLVGNFKPKTKRLGILREFEKSFGELNFNSFDQGMINEFTLFMRKEGYNDNSISYYVGKIRALLSHAKSFGVISEVPEFKNVAKGIDSGAVYLNDAEIQKIYKRIQKPVEGRHDQKTVKEIGEIFILGTQIGVRFSDFKISPENVFEKKGKKYLDLYNIKTSKQVIVPLTKLALEIFEKYNWKIPEYSLKRMNRGISLICKAAEINEVIISRAIESGKMEERNFFKWEMISSHTMRRSFCTNLFLKGAHPSHIMPVSGHSTIESFMRYIRISKQEAAEMLEKYF